VDVNSYFHDCRNYRPPLPSSAKRAATRPFSYQPLERFTIQTTESITGTSISTPTTVASAAPDWKPNRLIAAATASSKKLDAPITPRDGHAMLFAGEAVEQIGEPGVEVDLDKNRHGEQRDHERLRQDLLSLKANKRTRVASSATSESG